MGSNPGYLLIFFLLYIKFAKSKKFQNTTKTQISGGFEFWVGKTLIPTWATSDLNSNFGGFGLGSGLISKRFMIFFFLIYSIPIARKDLDTLRGLNWLNDEIINFYLNMIMARSKENDNWPNVHAFNTFFLSNIRTKGYASVKRWTRKFDLFSFDIILGMY